MSLPHLSLADARNLHLAAQGLLNKPRRRASLEDIPATISRMSLLQIDTINIVARSPYLVLFSRLGNYPAQWLDESLARGELMEYWAHEACFMPRSDFRLIRHRMLAPEKMGWKYKDAWMQEHEAEIAQLIQHIHDKGPVRSADFEHPRKGASGWWEWKPHKRHLEGLFTAGKLTATHSAVLSPFDPVVWDRKRAEQLFDFSYRLECYTPAPKRQYGYFVLPLLHRGQLVGRMDAKMHRQTGILEVISLWLQEGIKPTTTLQKGLRQAITDFANWQQATRVTLGCCPQGLFTDCRTGWEIDPVA
ncbi:winged helix-turn-helix domain-containing protein [Escherichia coli]|uniref:winged helix-turn-helix domain-containing protein n=1 Tax=Escherichia coli TaxID=562 RepID=UPI001068DB85|nr:winged helix-turn-helix domain-containing protein [Escherichia coli]